MNNKTNKNSLKINQTYDIQTPKKEDSSPLKQLNPSLINLISAKKFNLNNNQYIPLNQRRATIKFTAPLISSARFKLLPVINSL